MKKQQEQFVVHQAGVLIRNDKCLILEFADRPGNYWGLPGGRVEKGEIDSEKSFRREINEELGFSDFKILGMVDYDMWYRDDGQASCAIVLLIRDNNEKIILSEEHSQMKWVSEEELDEIKFLWPNAKRMIEKGFEYLNIQKERKIK